MENATLVLAWLWANIVGIIGIALSAYAIGKAKSAYTAAIEAKDSVVDRVKLDEQLKMIQDVSTALVGAKDVALRRQHNAPPQLNAGKKLSDDIHTLRIASDKLKTGLPDNLSQDRVREATSAAKDLDRSINEIGSSSAQRDGWGDALSALQLITASMQQEARSIRDNSLTK